MKPSEVRMHQERWRTSSGRQLTKDVARWLAGAARRPRDVRDIEGRADLRGLQFPDASMVGSFSTRGIAYQSIAGMPEFTGVEWRGLDLRGAVIRHARFKNATLIDCLFDSADLVDWRLWATVVSDSSFAGADLEGAALGTSTDSSQLNRWNGVSFDRANLRNASFTGGVLQNVTFRHAKIRRTRFDFLDMQSVTFEGLLESAQFSALAFRDEAQKDYWMRDVDFEGTLFKDGLLQGYRTGNVRLPPDVLLVRDFPAVYARAVESALLAGDKDLLATLEVERRLLREGSEHATWDFALFDGDLIASGMETTARKLRYAYQNAQLDVPQGD